VAVLLFVDDEAAATLAEMDAIRACRNSLVPPVSPEATVTSITRSEKGA
jgi:hypothetical protein